MDLVKKLVQAALGEDKARQDSAGSGLFNHEQASGLLIFKGREGVVCGLGVASRVFSQVDPAVQFKALTREGRAVKRGMEVARVKGKARSLLAAERTALNFLAHLSGIASKTRELVHAARGASFMVSDTRKTHPLLRELEKYAVQTGGGVPHRMNLSETAMIKDNHLRILKKNYPGDWPARLQEAVGRLKKRGEVEVEVQNLEELDPVLASKPHWVMLDNMSLSALRRAIAFIRKRKEKIKIEVSGGVTPSNVSRLARLDIDRVSSGAIIHSAPFADFSLELE